MRSITSGCWALMAIGRCWMCNWCWEEQRVAIRFESVAGAEFCCPECGEKRSLSLVLGVPIRRQRQKVLQGMVSMGDPLPVGVGEESGADAQAPFGSDTELVSASYKQRHCRRI